jgi:hypothetical protein
MELHCNFQLDRDGEYLALWDNQDPPRLVDALSPGYPPQSPHYSWGRNPQTGAFQFLFPASPGAENQPEEMLGTQVALPEFSPPGLITNDEILVSISCPTPQAVIYYTTDGSMPSETNGIRYSEPIPVVEPTSIRARAFRQGNLPSPDQCMNYLVKLPRNQNDLPALCLTASASETFFSPFGTGAIQGGTTNPWAPRTLSDYNHMIFHGRIVERPVHVQWIPRNEEDGPPFSFRSGIRIAGSDYMRPRYELGDDWINRQVQKLSFRLYPRADYGIESIPNTWMPASPLLDFKQITLRAGHNDWANPFIKDELARRLSLDMGLPAAIGAFCALFINGEYKGFYNPVPRPDESFFQAFYHTPNTFDVIQIGELKSGSFDRWNEVGSILSNFDLSDPRYYRRIEGMVDLENFVDYLILNTFAAMWDWPHNNWVAARENAYGAKFQYAVWDAEGGWGTHNVYNVYRNTLAEDVRAKPGSRIGALYNSLMANSTFRLMFADRIQKHLIDPEGALAEKNRNLRFSELRRTMAIPVSRTYGSFNVDIANQWFLRRPAIMMEHFQSEGLWDPTFVAPTCNVFFPEPQDPQDSWTVHIDNPNPLGTIYYTIDGSDPRNPLTGDATENAQAYAAPFSIQPPVRLLARAYDGNRWSPLLEKYLATEVSPGSIRITEYMADPLGEDDSREWFELCNFSSGAIDINGWIIRDNEKDYHVIQSGSPLLLEPGKCLVLGQSDDPSLNGGLSVDYTYGMSFSMNKNGDEIILQKGFEIIDSIGFGAFRTLTQSMLNHPAILPVNGSSTTIVVDPENPDIETWATASTPYGNEGNMGTPGALNTTPQPSSPAATWTVY